MLIFDNGIAYDNSLFINSGMLIFDNGIAYDDSLFINRSIEISKLAVKRGLVVDERGGVVVSDGSVMHCICNDKCIFQ